MQRIVVVFMLRTSSRQEIFVHIGGEIGCCAGLAAERLTVTDLLQVVHPAGDVLVAVAVEGVEIDAGTTVHAGVNLGAGQDRVAVGVHDTGHGGGVGVDKVAVGVGGIIRVLGVPVAQGRFNGSQRRNGAAVALELGLPLLIGCLNSRLDLLDG